MQSSASLNPQGHKPGKSPSGYQAIFIIALVIYIIIGKAFPTTNLDFFKTLSLALLTAGLGMLSYLISKFED